MAKESQYFIEGKTAYTEYHDSQAYNAYSRHIAPEDAIKLFWPPQEEMMSQVSSPLPKKRREWIAGWRAAELEAMKDEP